MELNFNNTDIAFSHKSTKELKRMFLLFKLISYPLIVKIGNLFIPVFLKLKLPILWLLKMTVFKQFCGGIDFDDCKKTLAKLNKYNLGAVLDYASEGNNNEKDFLKTKKEIIKIIEKTKKMQGVPFAVFKVTGLIDSKLIEKKQKYKGLTNIDKIAFDAFYSKVDEICKTAYYNNKPIFIDAEESWIQNEIDTIAFEMMLKYNKETPIVYNTLQMYRHDRLTYLRHIIDMAYKEQVFIGVKFVRGAYLEKEREMAISEKRISPIYNTKQETDDAFNSAVLLALEHLNVVSFCAATHNEESLIRLNNIIQQKNISTTHEHISTAQLYGMSDHISFTMAYHNFNVCKYVPYGDVKTTVPYLLRRAQENTSVAGQTLRELDIIRIELQRRKNNE